MGDGSSPQLERFTKSSKSPAAMRGFFYFLGFWEHGESVVSDSVGGEMHHSAGSISGSTHLPEIKILDCRPIDRFA